MGGIIGNIGYTIKVNYNSHGVKKQLTFTNVGQIGYSTSINVSKTASQGDHSASVIFLNIKDDITRFLFRTENTFGKSGMIEITTTRGIHCGRIFKGSISRAIPSGFPETNLTIDALCGNFFSELFTISATTLQTRHELKQMFANQMSFQLKDDVEEDKNIKLSKNFFYQGRSPLRRLQVFFQEQNVYVDGNSLCFIPRENKVKISNKQSARIKELSEKTGIIGTISVNDATSINVQHISLPDLQLGQIIKINCKFPNNAKYNGTWFINGLQNDLDIKNSPSATTTITLGATNFSM